MVSSLGNVVGAKEVYRPWLKEYVCEWCGEPFKASRIAHYCSNKCRSRASDERKRIRKTKMAEVKVDCPEMSSEYWALHEDKIAHQQDPSVWTRDYAERQKAKTLAMLGGIKV